MRLVRGVNSADLTIYVSNRTGNPNKERYDKHVYYNNLKDNTKSTSIPFFNEVIKPVEQKNEGGTKNNDYAETKDETDENVASGQNTPKSIKRNES